MFSNSDLVVFWVSELDLNLLTRLEWVVTWLVGVSVGQCQLLAKLERVV